MKTIKIIAIAIFAFVANSNAQQKKVEAKTSSINWVGKKVTGEHSGTINVQDGTLVFAKNKLKGGTITVDMSSIVVTDLKAGEGKEKLEGHLKADDFFGTDKFATATIVFKKIGVKSKNLYTVSADLTIKGITEPVTFDLKTTKNSATTNLKIDRTKYDIKYGSGSFFEGLGDKTISDEFELTVNLKF